MQIVLKRLIEQGVAANIHAVGYGKAQQVKACDDVQGAALRDCLRLTVVLKLPLLVLC